MKHLSDNKLNRLPVFPLDHVPLFPGLVLPLHVFEPRYRALLEHVTAADGALAVACLEPGFESDYEGRPPLRSVMGAGIVLRAERLEDGRWNILVRGTDRVRLVREWPPEQLFREVVVERLPDRPLPGPDDRVDQLRLLLGEVALATPKIGGAVEKLLEAGARDAALLTNLVGAHTIGNPATRQRLLETPDVSERLDICLSWLGGLLVQLHKADGGAVH